MSGLKNRRRAAKVELMLISASWEAVSDTLTTISLGACEALDRSAAAFTRPIRVCLADVGVSILT